MKNAHLTLRIPAMLARTLDTLARVRGVPKSQVVREAVASYLAPPPDSGRSQRSITGTELARLWLDLPRLDDSEAEAFARDIASGRSALPAIRSTWE